MDLLHQLETEIIIAIQSLGPWLVEPMRFMSMLGYEQFFLLIMPAIYWCFDAILGIRMAAMLLLSTAINTMFKLSFHSPRPYWINTQVHAYSSEYSFGLPSLHAQAAAGIWGVLAASMQKRWEKIALVIVIFLIGFSRIYLGVHFISDVVLGWLLGGLTLLLYLKFEQPLINWLRKRSHTQHLLLALACAVFGALMVLVPGMALSDWQMPASWQANAYLASPQNVLTPTSLNDAFTVSGVFLGFLGGIAWLFHRHGGFDAAGTPQQRLLRYVIGIAGTLILWYGLGSIFPRDETVLAYSLRFFRYTLIGAWISTLAPLVFIRMGLANSIKGQTTSLSAR